MRRIDVPGRWGVRAAGDVPRAFSGRTFQTTLPSCVHLALLEAGAIPDPHVADNERAVAWVERVDWEYSVTFPAPLGIASAERLDLVLEGVDTFASIVFNGTRLGDVANMHHPHRFDVRSLLGAENTLTIRFRSAVDEVLREQARLGRLPFLNTEAPFPFARKCAYHFGWDWAPALAGCGLAAARLEAWSGARIVSVRPSVLRATEERALLRIDTTVDGDARCDVELAMDGRVVARGDGEHSIELAVDRPRRWWPRGHGQAPLYDLVVSSGADWIATRTGLRTVELDTAGGAFTLVVNHKPIYCKGANVVPQDSFFPRATDPARYQAHFQTACGANMNMLRVWGGGFYETDIFYDRCDELGLLVWQDFMFACACYPEEEPHWSRVEAEARFQIERLARHPSLVLWNGCNENLWGYFDWGWAERTAGRSWGRRYYFELLPRLCDELDPSRPYWPGSPYSGGFDPPNAPHPNDSAAGNKHMWEEWSGTSHPVIGREAPRFVSEFGFQGPPSTRLLDRAMRGAGAQLSQHQKSPRAEELAMALVRAHFGEPATPEREHYLRQVVQARAVTAAIEWFRSQWPTNAGALFWQLGDSWPAISWSAIDHDLRKKPLWYGARRAFADRLLTFQPESPGSSTLALYLVNDSDQPFEGEGVVTLDGFDGRERARKPFEIIAAPRSVHRVPIPSDILPDDISRELLVGRAGGLVAHHFFGADKDLALPPARIGASWQGHTLRLVAETLVRDVVIAVDRLDPGAELDEQLFTLLPGESVDVELRGCEPLPLERILASPVLQSAAAR